jgi:hypothetical protein
MRTVAKDMPVLLAANFRDKTEGLAVEKSEVSTSYCVSVHDIFKIHVTHEILH